MDFLIVKLVAVLPLEATVIFVTKKLVSAFAKLVLVEKDVIHAKISIMVKIVSLANARHQML
jgi:hypothetical protein